MTRITQIPFTQVGLLRKVGQPCTYCQRPMTELGKTQVTRDHAYPKSKGYSYAKFNGKNKIWCCARCNLDKKDDNILQWWFRLFEAKDKRAKIVMRILIEWHSKGFIKQNHAKKHIWKKFLKEYKECLKQDLAAPEEIVAHIVMRIGSDFFLCSDLVPHLELQGSTKTAPQPTTVSG